MPKLSDLKPKEKSKETITLKEKEDKPISKSTLEKKVRLEDLNLDVILTTVNNYLKGYRTAYNNAKNDPLSETKKKYENILQEKEKIEAILKAS